MAVDSIDLSMQLVNTVLRPKRVVEIRRMVQEYLPEDDAREIMQILSKYKAPTIPECLLQGNGRDGS